MNKKLYHEAVYGLDDLVSIPGRGRDMT